MISPIPSSAYTEQSANQPYEDALASFYQSELNAAVIHLKNALKNNPKHLPSIVLLAEVYLAIGDGAAAEHELEKARENNADESKVLPLILEAYLLQQKYDLVINTTTSTLQTKRLLSDILVLQGRALIETNKFEQARVLFQDALLKSPKNIKAQLGIAQVLLLKRNYPQMRVYINKALAISSINNTALVMLANLEQLEGNSDKSLKIISQVITLNNKDFPALLTRASLYIELESYQQALIDLAVILKEIPNEPKANYLNLVANSALGNQAAVDKTEAHITTVLTGLPEDVMRQNPIYLYLAGVVSFQKNNYIRAQDFLKKYLEIINEDPRALKLLARIELALKNPFIAKTLLVKARLISPDDIETWSLLGQVYSQLDETSIALKYFEDVVKEEPNRPEPLYDLAKLQLISGQHSQAIKNLVKAKSIEPNIAITTLLAKAYQSNKQYQKALTELNNVLSIQENNSDLHLQKGMVLGLLNEHDLAKKSLTKSLALDNTNLNALVHLARIALAENKPKQAIDKIKDKMAELTEPNVFLLIELGNINRQLRKYETALSNYNKAYKIDNNNQSALINLMELHITLSQVKQAISLAEEFLKRNNKSGDIYLALANLHMANKAHEEAYRAYQFSIKYSKNKSAAYNLFADAQLKSNDNEGAILSLKRAISWNSEKLSSYVKLFTIYAKQKEKQLAFAVLEKIKNRSSNNVFIYNLTGDLYRYLEQFPKAESNYLLAMDVHTNQQSIYGLYRIYKQQKHYDKALILLNKWIEKNPGDLASQIAIADSLVATKQLQLAADKYRYLLSKFSAMPILLNNAAQVLIQLKQYQEAQRYAEEASEALPNNVAVMDTLAWVYTLNKQAKKALPIFRQAIVKDFNNAEIKYHLAVALNQLDRNVEAVKYLQDAIDSDNHFNDKNKAITLLNQLNTN